MVFRRHGKPTAPLVAPEAEACMLAGVNWVKLQCKVMRYEYVEGINARIVKACTYTRTHADRDMHQASSPCTPDKVHNCSEGPPVRDGVLVNL